jgi:multidrug efflux pump subunit AcrB
MSIPSFGVRHPVPVNLLMIGALAGGVVCAMTLTREFFPEVTPESAIVTLPYPGASPQEIEEGMALKVEDALAEMDEIDRITTTIAEGNGVIVAEFRSGLRDVSRAVDDVERTIPGAHAHALRQCRRGRDEALPAAHPRRPQEPAGHGRDSRVGRSRL